ncbi:MAG TPA: hypothetical protein VGD99_03685 [Anaerolineae bacterium]|jgi:hypothetical protein
MLDKDTAIKQIREAFGQTEYPGDHFLQGSFEGSEPSEVTEPFKGRTDWQGIDAELLDANYSALNFFSEGALRFFLPAYLIADVQAELQTADPLFVLTHGFSDVSIEHQIGTRTFVRKTDQSTFINPRRYGGMTFYDYARYRLSVFIREEAQAIVAYLNYKREADPYKLQDQAIEAALNLFWLERTAHAPTAASLKQHLKEEDDYLAAIISESSGGSAYQSR